MSWIRDSRTVGTFNDQNEIHPNYPLVPINELALISVHPYQLRVNWMVLMITIINWVSRIKKSGSKLVGQFIQLIHGY